MMSVLVYIVVALLCVMFVALSLSSLESPQDQMKHRLDCIVLWLSHSNHPLAG